MQEGLKAKNARKAHRKRLKIQIFIRGNADKPGYKYFSEFYSTHFI